MKNNYLKNILTVVMLLCATAASAYDFKVGNVYYNILSAEQKTVEVTKDDSQHYCYYGDVVIPETVTYEGVTYDVTRIGSTAFGFQKYVTSITIGTNIRSIHQDAFSSFCEQLEKVYINDLSAWCKINFEGATNPLTCTSQTFLYVNGNVLVDLVIPEDITEIKAAAFDGCRSLKSVTLHDKITSIGEDAFDDCYKLTSIQFPNSLTNIGRYAFRGTALTEVELPSSVTTIAYGAFDVKNELTAVTSHISAADLVATYGFIDNKIKNATLTVPAGTKSVYATTAGWSSFTNVVEAAYDFELTVSDAGYATLYLGAAAEIPKGVSVYTANQIEGNLLKMELVEGTIPANTGVIVKAAKGPYKFHCVTDEVAAISNSMLKGSIINKTINVPTKSQAFVLSKVDGAVGMYPANLTDGSFLNNANKAYLMVGGKNLGVFDDEELDSSTGQLSNGFHFLFPETTGVESVKTETVTTNIYYDLQGRQVAQPTRGLYILNGKKVYVK